MKWFKNMHATQAKIDNDNRVSYIEGHPIGRWSEGEETALVCPEGYFILLGDHRAEYEKIVDAGGGIAECMKYFHRKNKVAKFKSSWSD